LIHSPGGEEFFSQALKGRRLRSTYALYSPYMKYPMDNNIAILIPQLVVGGAQRSMLKLAGGIAARGFGVDIVTVNTTGELLSEIPEPVRLVDLKSQRAITCVPALIRYLQREKPCALLSVLHTNVIAIWAKYLSCVRTRVIVSERNTFSSRVTSFSSDFRMRLMPKLVQYLYPSADCVVAVSQGVADDLVNRVGIPKERVTVIYNPVITPEFRFKVMESLRHPWFEPGQPPVILSVGRLVAQKDFVTLIHSFARILETQDARLLILGEGEERPSLEMLVRRLGLNQNVSMPGFIRNPYPYMKKASVFVLSSRYEGLPGVLIEALFCGTRLVATDCPSGPREILADGKYGQLVPVGDVEAMVQAITLALTGKSDPPSQAGCYPFLLENVVDRYIDLALGNQLAL